MVYLYSLKDHTSLFLRSLPPNYFCREYLSNVTRNIISSMTVKAITCTVRNKQSVCYESIDLRNFVTLQPVICAFNGPTINPGIVV